MEGEDTLFPWLPPDDRLWRHPSELQTSPLPITTLPSRESDHRLWAVALAAGLIGALLASGVGVAAGSFRQSTTVVRPVEQVVDTVSASEVIHASDPKATDVETIADQMRPAMVELLVTGDQGNVSGSGVIFRSDGYVLTNNHVIQGASSITAVMSDGRKVKARKIGTDPLTDIAVVKLDQPSSSVAMLGTAESLKVGQMAVAIGSPLGLTGGPSVTVGVVSAIGRQVDSGDGIPLLDMIQTDAPIAPGSSGGALMDASGEVIGITTALATDDSGPRGLGFATPVDVARSVGNQLIASGHATHVWLGVQGDDLDSQTADTLDIPGAAQVQEVERGSPAAKAGLTTADVIVGVDNDQITSMGSLMVDIGDRRAGDRVTIDYLRNGRKGSVQTVLTERPATLPG
jgi:S1-C subfamily serine protease